MKEMPPSFNMYFSGATPIHTADKSSELLFIKNSPSALAKGL